MLDRPQAKFIDRDRCINCQSSNLTEIARGRIADPPLATFIEQDPHAESPLPYLRDAVWAFVRCALCGQMFHRHVMDDEWNGRAYSEWISADAIKEFCDRAGANKPQAKYDAARSRISHALRLEKMTRNIRRPDETLRVLDFGCGFGEFVNVCTQFGFDAYGVDFAKPRTEAAETRIFPSLDALPQMQFHAVTMFEVLEHVIDPSAILRRIVEWIEVNGILVLETPDCTGVSGIRSHQDYRLISPLGHINAFTNLTLKSMAERHGFRCTPRGPAHVTADRVRVLKREARHLLGRDGLSTQLYFRHSHSSP